MLQGIRLLLRRLLAFLVSGFDYVNDACCADVSLLEEAPARRSEQLIYHLLLDYLSAAVQGSGSSSTESSSSITAVARRFMCCRMLNDTVYLSKRLSGGAEATKEELSTLLVQHRQLQDSAVSGLGEIDTCRKCARLLCARLWWAARLCWPDQ